MVIDIGIDAAISGGNVHLSGAWDPAFTEAMARGGQAPSACSNSTGARMCHASVMSSLSRRLVTFSSRSITSGQPSYPRGAKKNSGSPEQECLLLRLVPDVEHRDVVANHPPLPGLVLGVGPDEPPVAHPEVEALTRLLLDARQRQRDRPHVLRIRHGGRLAGRSDTRKPLTQGRKVSRLRAAR